MQSLFEMLPPLVNFRFPAGGDVNMDYRPWTNWGDADPNAGNQRIEDVIFRNVALPGRQLGRLIDVVRLLIEIAAHDHPGLESRDEQTRKSIDDFRSMADDIDRQKKFLQETTLSQARRTLDRLKTANKDAFKSLLREYQSEQEA